MAKNKKKKKNKVQPHTHSGKYVEYDEQDDIKDLLDEEPTVVIIKENPLLRKIQLPGQMFRLPSRGIFYKDGELDKKIIDGEVEVFPMKTIDEITLKTTDMIFQGTAITRVFERCIPDIKKPLKLLSEDVDYLIGCLRQVSYGNALPIKANCEQKSCEKHPVREYTIPLNQILISNTTELDDKNIEKDYTYVLHNEALNTTQDIQFKPILFEQLVKMYQFRAEQDMSFQEIENDDDVDAALEKALSDFVTMTISSLVESVDGITDRDHIFEWCAKLPIKFKDELAEKVEGQTDWGTKFEYTVECFDCQSPIDLTASLNPVGFFTLPSSPTKST